jgi:hypothetical protein
MRHDGKANDLHPTVRMSLVRSRRNPITGTIVVADVVLRTEFWRGS